MRGTVAAALAAAALLAAGCDHHAELAGPAGLPYACADGRAARIVYDGGDPNRMPARLTFDGREYELMPDAAMSGLRYRSEGGLAPGRGLIWSAEGDEAVLSAFALDPASGEGEREIVRCTRLREGEAAPPAGHGEDH